MKQLTPALRKTIESTILKSFDAVDKSGNNSEYYRNLFGTMTDKQFVEFCSLKFPFRLHYKPSVVEPKMSDITEALAVIGVPLMEKLSRPDIYQHDGHSVQTQECLVGYIPVKRQQQMVVKKNKHAAEIDSRDISGRLTGADKGSQTSERQFESLEAFGLDITADEFAKPKGDAMEAKNAMYAQIAATGMVRMSDLPNKVEDSIARNLLDAYLIACHIDTNLVNYQGYTQATMKNKTIK